MEQGKEYGKRERINEKKEEREKGKKKNDV
jgi:hypothetical protein